MTHFDYDYIIIGSGFGGSTAAHRLSEKGYQVGVFEMGKRYDTQDFPKTNWNLKKFMWLPFLGLHGFFRMKLFKHVWVLAGTGVGGGSLVYANTLLKPEDSVWNDPQWQHLKNWKSIMPSFYKIAQKMLGVTKNQYLGNADKCLRKTAEALDLGSSFYQTDVGIYFGEKDITVNDPYFDGLGPERTGCNFCGGCMVGCRYGAKNTLDKNYLYLAGKQGTSIIPETKVTSVKPTDSSPDGHDGYEITTKPTFGFFKKKKVYRSKGIIFSGGVLGTVPLLLKSKEEGYLPRLSDKIGNYVRTNSEAIIGVRMKDKSLDYSDGIAIGSGIYVDQDTHIEPVRYSEGSDSLSLLTTLLVGNKPGILRILKWLGTVLAHPVNFLKMLNPFGFAKSTVILLVMQPISSYLQLKFQRLWFFPFLKRLQTINKGEKIPVVIPQANDFARKMAKLYGGVPLTSLTEIFLNVPTTAHILGGAIMGKNVDEGVIDAQNRVFNYQNMFVCDGSMIGANLGVNPSLSIVALTEHAMSYIESKPNAFKDCK
ncbi:MAG: GMC family oxidoreductase [Deltaproteobacteria bacterium]|nr:GMC family oxidoreductase [Deltaproteobacteria bacterium]